MLYLPSFLIFCLLIPDHFVFSELVINEVSLENENNPKFVYVELLNKGDPVVEENYLIVFYAENSTLSLSISKLNNVSLGSDGLNVVVTADSNLAIPRTANIERSTDLPFLGDTIAAIALFKITLNESFSASQVGFNVENATRVDVLVFMPRWTPKFSASDLAIAFGTKQIIIGNLRQSLSLCGNEMLSFKNSTKTPGSENKCDLSDPVSVATPAMVGSTLSGTIQNSSERVPNMPVTPVIQNPVAKVVISEVYVNPRTPNDIGEYVELQDLSGKENVALDGMTLVFWNGANLNKYFTIDLTGYSTGPNGYFVISNDNDNDTHIYHSGRHFIQNGPMDGIVLYKDINQTDLEDGNIPTHNILDAVVYTNLITIYQRDTLLTTLFPNQRSAVVLHRYSNLTVLTRCFSNESMDLSAFRSMNITTKAAPNYCFPPEGLRINELKLSSNKFIEITSGEKDFFPLEQMILTTYNLLTNQRTGSLRLKGRTNQNLCLLAEQPLLSTLLVDDKTISTILDTLNDTIPGAVALYWRPDLDSDLDIPMTTEGLLDIVIYGTDTVKARSEFLLTFQKTQVTLLRDLGDNSVSYCPHGEDRYVISVPSPNSENLCTIPQKLSSTTADSLITSPTTRQYTIQATTRPMTPSVDFQISEVYFGESPNFVEISGPVNESLDNLLVVFLQTGNPIGVIRSFNMASKRLSPAGLYVLDGPTVTLPHSEDGDSAVVLYHLPTPRYRVTTFDQLSHDATLLDFVVYSTRKTMTTSDLMKKFAGPQTQQIAIWAVKQSSLSITRCLSPLKEIWSFWLMQQSKDSPNICLVPEVLINEINADNPSFDDREFLELYDFGVGGVSLNPFVLVSFNGQNVKKRAVVVNLWNERTDENGFYLLAGAGQNLSLVAQKSVPQSALFFQNGPDAIALFKASPIKFSETSQPTTEGLLDVVIYGKKALLVDTLIWSLVAALTPGGSSVRTAQDKSIDLSMSRCLCWGTSKNNNAKAFTLSQPTPAKVNICPQNFTAQLPPLEEIFINEFNLQLPEKSRRGYVELKGPKMAQLDNLGLVFYNFSNGQAIHTIKLDGYSLDEYGLYLYVLPSWTDSEVANQQQLLLDHGKGGVALYDRRHWECVPESQMTISRPGLLDAVAYTSTSSDVSPPKAQQYLKALTLDNYMYVVEDSRFLKEDVTINRCFDDHMLSHFSLSVPTPGQPNICPADKYQVQISFKLTDSDCVEFNETESLKVAVVNHVVTQLNTICQCGFTVVNLASFPCVCGNVIFNATINTFNQQQHDLMETSYREFIECSDTVVSANKIYSVNKSSLQGCPRGKHATKQTDHTLTIAVVVTSVLILAVVFILVFIYLRRKQTGHFYMKPFDGEEKNRTGDDGIYFVGSKREQARFDNAVYLDS